jgi:hypothetical protein
MGLFSKYKGTEEGKENATTETTTEETTEETAEETAEETTPAKQKPEAKAKNPNRLRKAPFVDPLPNVKNGDKVKIKIVKDFNKHKAGETKEVTGFLAKVLVFKKVAKIV